MQVWEVMTREVVPVGPQTSAEYTAELMGERRRRALVAGRRPRDRVSVGRPAGRPGEDRAYGTVLSGADEERVLVEALAAARALLAALTQLLVVGHRRGNRWPP